MAQVFNSNMAYTAYEYTKVLLVPVTKQKLKQSIEENAFYPSLYSISSVFEKYGISNEAYKVNDTQPYEIPTPYIAYIHTKEAGKDFALVTSTDQNLITYSYNHKTYTVLTSEFEKIWEKIVFIAKPAENSGDPDYQINKLESCQL